MIATSGSSRTPAGVRGCAFDSGGGAGGAATGPVGIYELHPGGVRDRIRAGEFDDRYLW